MLLPNFLQKPVADLSKMATPLALVILGAEFNFGQVRKCVRQLVIGVSGRLVVMPLIFLTIAVLLGFRGEELIALLVMLAAPPAVSTAFAVSYSQFVPGKTGMRKRGFAVRICAGEACRGPA